MAIKRQHFRRYQRMLVGIFILMALALLFPFMNKNDLIRILIPHSRFHIPIAPKFSYTVDPETNASGIFGLLIKQSKNATVEELQAKAYPAFLMDHQLLIGPYLDEFASQVDWRDLKPVANKVKRTSVDCCFILNSA